jgi:hypothetical protein
LARFRQGNFITLETDYWDDEPKQDVVVEYY